MKKQSSHRPQAHRFSGNNLSFCEDTLTLHEGDVRPSVRDQYERFIKKKPSPAIWDEQIKRLISRSIWPRLLVIRIRKVLVTLTPIITMFEHPYVIEGLGNLNFLLGALGWLLHGLRLLMNLFRLLMQCLPINSLKNSCWQSRLLSEFSLTQMELGNDLLWISATLINSTYIGLSLAFLLLDIAWVLYGGYVEVNRLNQFKCVVEKALQDEGLPTWECAEIMACSDNLEQRLTYTQQKLILSLITTLSTAVLSLLRFAIIRPASVINPVVPVVFALLSLGITLVSHFAGEWLRRCKPPEIILRLDKCRRISTTENVVFFKPKNSENRSVAAVNEAGLNYA